MLKKTCTGCHKKLPATLEFFSKHLLTKDGLQTRCRICVKLYGEKYFATINGHLRRTFACMKQRCNDPKHPKYKYYGGRGIKVCFESATEFVNYVIDKLKIDPRGLTIDRIDNDGNYECGNIQFVTHRQNQQNKSEYRKRTM